MDNTDNLLPQAAQDETPGLRRASRVAVSQQAEAAPLAKAMPPDCYAHASLTHSVPATPVLLFMFHSENHVATWHLQGTD